RFAGDLIEGALPFDDFQGILRFEFGAVTGTGGFHLPLPFQVFWTFPSTLYHCPNSWGHYSLQQSIFHGLWQRNRKEVGFWIQIILSRLIHDTNEMSRSG